MNSSLDAQTCFAKQSEDKFFFTNVFQSSLITSESSAKRIRWNLFTFLAKEPKERNVEKILMCRKTDGFTNDVYVGYSNFFYQVKSSEAARLTFWDRDQERRGTYSITIIFQKYRSRTIPSLQYLFSVWSEQKSQEKHNAQHNCLTPWAVLFL